MHRAKGDRLLRASVVHVCDNDVGSGRFFGFKILNFNIFVFSEKLIFFGYEDFVDIFWVITKKYYI